MPKYLILRRSKDDPATSKPGSLEETACAIAEVLTQLPLSAERLRAIPVDGPAATFATLKESAICSITIDKKSQNFWNSEVFDVQESFDQFITAKNRAEQNLNDALTDMKEKLYESRAFSNLDPEDDISVYSALDTLGESDFHYKFIETLRGQYQYQKMRGLFDE